MQLFGIVLLTLILSTTNILVKGIDHTSFSWIDSLPQDVNAFLTTGKRSENFEKAVSSLRHSRPHLGRKDSIDNQFLRDLQHVEPKGIVECSLCHQGLDIVLGWIANGATRDEIFNRLSTLCSIILPTYVCDGAIELNIDIILWIVDQKNQTGNPITSDIGCGFVLYPDCQFDTTNYEWELDLSFLPPKPEVDIPEIPEEGSSTFKILQLPDVHVDPYYLAGGNAECDAPVCCRSEQGDPPTPEAAAGYWGDYRQCDIPMRTYKSMLQDAVQRHQDIRYVIFTGDIIDHAVWATSPQSNENTITAILDELRQSFPNITIMPILGNHEASPINVFSDPFKTEIPDEISTVWLYEFLADIWTQNFLPIETRDSIAAGGRYSVEVIPGLVIIGLNSMFGYKYNWWMLYDDEDPAGQLVWLAKELQHVESEGKKAHILAHIPSGRYDCLHFWSYQYRKIVDRFESTIVNQIHGHTHHDHFFVYYSQEEPERASNIGIVGGSVTTYKKYNPNYRVYTADANTFRLLDHETWFFNLTEANLAGPSAQPRWQKMYSFNEVYGTRALFPAEMDQLAHRIAESTDLQELYRGYYYKLSEPALTEPCDDRCLKDLVCEIVTTVIDDSSQCKALFS